ncbi:MAG: NAD-dependent epimerase/dehydratase family protein, partial [Elusimicrobiales bacterium]
VNYGRNSETLYDIVNDNLLFSIKLLETASFFNIDTFFNTDTLLAGYLNYYTLTKKHFVDYLKIFPKYIRIVNMKLEHMYGPRDDEKKFVKWIIKSLIENVGEINLTRGEQKRDFIYIDDVVNAYLLVLDKIDNIGKGFNEFDVGTGKFITIKDFVLKIKNIIENKFNKKIETKLNFGALPYRENELFEIKENLCPLLNFGWNPKYDLDLGLYETIKYELEVKK